MERLDATKPASAEDLFDSIRETRERVNALMEENDLLVEKIANLEGEIDKFNKRVELTEKALMKNIQNVALHKHADTGEALTPLAV